LIPRLAKRFGKTHIIDMSVLDKLGVPAFNVEKGDSIDSATYRLKVTGLVEEEREFSFEEIKRMPFTRQSARLTSVSGWSVRAEWEGVSWADFLKLVRPKSGATHVTFKSPGGYDTSVGMKDLENPRVMIVYGVEGAPLESKFGGPVRMIIPNLWGYKSCKWMFEIEFKDHMENGFWESRGYTPEGYIEPGWTLDVNTRQRRPIKGGEIVEF